MSVQRPLSWWNEALHQCPRAHSGACSGMHCLDVNNIPISLLLCVTEPTSQPLAAQCNPWIMCQRQTYTQPTDM